MRKSRSRWWNGAILIGCIVFLILIVRVWLLSHQTLLQASTRITEAPTAIASPLSRTSQSAHFFWLSDHDLLCIVSRDWTESAYRLDTRTGRRTAIGTLETAFRQIVPSGEMHLSPDGKWLLWAGVRRPQSIPPLNGHRYVLPRPGNHLSDYRVVATALDGSQQIERQQGNGLAWLRDSQGWARLLWTDQVPRSFHVQLQTFASTPPIEQPVTDITEMIEKRSYAFIGKRSFSFLGMCQVLGVTQANHLLAWTPSDLQHSGTCFYDLAFTPNTGHSRSYIVKLPAGMTVDDMAISAQGDRLAWKLFSSRFLYPALLRRLFPSLTNANQPVVSLWVSRMDGSGLHEVGQQDAPKRDGWTNILYDLTWTPDGKRLSFVYGDTLYTVPIDEDGENAPRQRIR